MKVRSQKDGEEEREREITHVAYPANLVHGGMLKRRMLNEKKKMNSSNDKHTYDTKQMVHTPGWHPYCLPGSSLFNPLHYLFRSLVHLSLPSYRRQSKDHPG